MQSFPADLRIINPVTTLAGADGLSSINTNELSNGALCVVNENNSIYHLRKTSVAAAASPRVIAPAAGPGRWHLYGQGANSFVDANITIAALAAGAGAEVGVAAAGIVDNDDVVVFALKDSSFPVGIMLFLPRITGAGVFTLRSFNAGAAPYAGGSFTLRVAVFPSP